MSAPAKHIQKCPTCGKVAKAISIKEIPTSKGEQRLITLECFHVIFESIQPTKNYSDITFDGDSSCAHEFGSGKSRTVCMKCGAKRLFEYQILGAKFIERANGKAAIFDEQGLGKTIQAIAYLKYNKDALPFLWVTKSGIKYQHGKEIIRLLGIDHIPQIIQKGTDQLIHGMKCYIASYDIFRRMNIEQFQKVGIQTIVLDECQAIKNPDSTRTQVIRQITKHIPKIILLSGTPWKNRGSELFVALNMLDPRLFYSLQQFRDRYVDSYMHGNKEKEGGFRDPEAFRELISHIAIRRERVEVMPELPLISRHKFTTQIEESARKTYEKEEKILIDNYNQSLIDGDEDSFETHKKLMQSLIIMRQIVGIAKVPATVEIAQEFLEETDRKLVIFVHHVRCGEMIFNQLSNFCAENGIAQPLQLTGNMSAEERFEIQEKFNSRNYRILIASTLASGEGLNLQTCSDCIMHERQWNPANEEQAEGRFIRIGQQATAVVATYVHAENSVDTDLDEIVESKRMFINAMMNKNATPEWDSTSIESALIKRIAERKR